MFVNLYLMNLEENLDLQESVNQICTVVISNTETFPNQFQQISESLEKFPNLFGIISKCSEKISNL